MKPDNFPANVQWRSLDRCGWHFTHLGGPAGVREKLRAYVHKGGKYDDMLAERGIEERMLTGRHPGNLTTLRLTKVDDTMPQYVSDNEMRYLRCGYLKCPWERIAELESLTEVTLKRVADSTLKLQMKQMRQRNDKLKAQISAQA
jgi:hypothetical protein